MATYSEICYACLDLLKERSDDAYYTEEHVLFLASKIRALLLERKYKNTRNATFQSMSSENVQQICLDVVPEDFHMEGCVGGWLKSVQEVPDMLGVSEPKVYPIGDMLRTIIGYVPMERLPYVGYNKWLRHIVYAARSTDKHLYLNGSNTQFMYLNKVKMEGVFSDPLKAAELSCNPDGNGKCDILNMTFPLEQSLVPSCIEMVVQELMGSRYAPEDKGNNAKDDLGDAAVSAPRHPRPAENSTYKAREEEAE